MRKFTLFLFCILIWLALIWPFGDSIADWDWPALVIGIVMSLVVSVMFGEIFVRSPYKFFDVRRYLWALIYIPVLGYYILLSNLDMAYRVLHPKLPIAPGIVRVRTRLRSRSGITALCNSITLTPGTMVVDVEGDGTLYIHWIAVSNPEELSRAQKLVDRFEKIIARIFE